MRNGRSGAWIIVGALSVGVGAGWYASSNSALARGDEPSISDRKMPPPPREWTFATKDPQWAGISASIGKPAPSLSAKDWHGDQVKADDLKGQIIVIDFWATWCGPCIRAIPHTNEMASSFADRGVKIVGVCAARGGETMAKVAKQYKMAYPTGFDASDATSRAFGVQWYPYYVVVDRKGIIRAAGLTPDRVDDVVEALLVEQPLPAVGG